MFTLQVDNQIPGLKALELHPGQGPFVEDHTSGAEGPLPSLFQAIQAEEAPARRVSEGQFGKFDKKKSLCGHPPALGT